MVEMPPQRTLGWRRSTLQNVRKIFLKTKGAYYMQNTGANPVRHVATEQADSRGEALEKAPEEKVMEDEEEEEERAREEEKEWEKEEADLQEGEHNVLPVDSDSDDDETDA
eukprot:234700-Prorocentrum_minimum.AAC.1